jgi:hypothetical protein
MFLASPPWAAQVQQNNSSRRLVYDIHQIGQIADRASSCAHEISALPMEMLSFHRNCLEPGHVENIHPRSNFISAIALSLPVIVRNALRQTSL